MLQFSEFSTLPRKMWKASISWPGLVMAEHLNSCRNQILIIVTIVLIWLGCTECQCSFIEQVRTQSRARSLTSLVLPSCFKLQGVWQKITDELRAHIKRFSSLIHSLFSLPIFTSIPHRIFLIRPSWTHSFSNSRVINMKLSVLSSVALLACGLLVFGRPLGVPFTFFRLYLVHPFHFPSVLALYLSLLNPHLAHLSPI